MTIVLPARPAVIRAKRCETCGCAGLDATGRHLECHFTLRDALVPGPSGQPQAVSYYPPTQPDGWCVEGWKPKVELLNGH